VGLVHKISAVIGRFLWELKSLLETTDLRIFCPATAENLLGLLLKVEKFPYS